MNKPSQTSYPLHELLAERWSPRAFADASMSVEQLGSLLEAARWAPSCFNAQPWRFLAARREDVDGFARLAACLAPTNAWAKAAPLLVLSVARLDFEHDGKPNRHALHDVGLAVGNLTVQAQALGLSVHQMAGFDAERARTSLGIPAGFEPVTLLAIGRRGAPDGLPEALRARELAPRSRKPLGEILRGAAWDAPSPLG